MLWFAQNSLPLRWQRQHVVKCCFHNLGCDLLKIHYLCGDKDNCKRTSKPSESVVICSKFITFAVTKTTRHVNAILISVLWFAQNSLPLRWQRQPLMKNGCNVCVVICSKFITFAVTKTTVSFILVSAAGCDLLKIHYLCGDKDNFRSEGQEAMSVVICSKFITFAVTKTTFFINSKSVSELWFAQNSLPLRWQRQRLIDQAPTL